MQEFGDIYGRIFIPTEKGKMESRSKSHQTAEVKNDTRFTRFLRLVKNNFGVAISIGIGLINFLILIVLCIVWLNQNGSSTPVQEYYINVLDHEYGTRFNCNLKELDGVLACDNREVYGVFSKYDSIELLGAKTDNDTFRLEFSCSVPKEFYETSEFNLDNFPDEKEVSLLIGLHDKILDKILLSKEVKIIFTFDENDKELVSKTHDDWLAKEAENKTEVEIETQAKSAIIQGQAETTTSKTEESTTVEVKEESSFPTDSTDMAVGTCIRKALDEFNINLYSPYFYDSYWSGKDYIQTFAIEFPALGGLRIICDYHWKMNFAISVSFDNR